MKNQKMNFADKKVGIFQFNGYGIAKNQLNKIKGGTDGGASNSGDSADGIIEIDVIDG